MSDPTITPSTTTTICGRQGWICPRCGASNSPDERQCPTCQARNGFGAPAPWPPYPTYPGWPTDPDSSGRAVPHWYPSGVCQAGAR